MHSVIPRRTTLELACVNGEDDRHADSLLAGGRLVPELLGPGVDGKSGAEDLIAKALDDPAILQSLVSAPKDGGDSEAESEE